MVITGNVAGGALRREVVQLTLATGPSEVCDDSKGDAPGESQRRGVTNERCWIDHGLRFSRQDD